MKKTILILLTFVSFLTYGQNETPQHLQKSEKKDRFTSQHAELTTDNKVILREKVVIETELLYLEADSAVIDKKNQLLLAYGTRNCTFKGGEAVINPNAKSTIRYKMNDKVIYIE